MSRMMLGNTILAIFFMVAFFTTTPVESVFADTRYVSDQLVISVRQGENPGDKVLGYIKTATPVDVIEEKGDYSRIKTEDDLEGWVLTRYLVSEKPKALIIENLKNEIRKLNEKFESSIDKRGVNSKTLLEAKKMYEEKIAELEKEVDINQKFTAKSKSDLIQLDNKYKNLLAQSQNTEKLIREAEELRQLNTHLHAEIKSLKQQIRSPLKSKSIRYFVAGAGVLLFGYLLGASAKKKKRSRFI